CEWLKANPNKWQKYVLPPAACTQNDYTFTFSACDERTSTHTITYMWLLPKACQGGVALPSPTTIDCGYNTAHDPQSQTMIAVTAAEFLLVLTILGLS